MTIPTFLIAGAARSGTTGLVHGLRTHPRVFVTEPKEPHYFAYHGQPAAFTGPGDDRTINRVAVTDVDAYLALYPDASDHLALGDASVSTLYAHAHAIPELIRINPRMRVVVILREPVARAYSAHQYMLAKGWEPEPDFLAAVEQEGERIARGWHHIWHYTAMSRYADGLLALRAALGPEQVRVWFHDDLERDYETTVAEVLRFIGVPAHPGEGDGVPRVNVSGRPRVPAVTSALAWVAGHERLRQRVKQHTSFEFRERVRRVLVRSDDLPTGARDRLAPLFADDLERLRALLPEGPGWLGGPSGADDRDEGTR